MKKILFLLILLISFNSYSWEEYKGYGGQIFDLGPKCGCDLNGGQVCGEECCDLQKEECDEDALQCCDKNLKSMNGECCRTQDMSVVNGNPLQCCPENMRPAVASNNGDKYCCAQGTTLVTNGGNCCAQGEQIYGAGNNETCCLATDKQCICAADPNNVICVSCPEGTTAATLDKKICCKNNKPGYYLLQEKEEFATNGQMCGCPTPGSSPNQGSEWCCDSGKATTPGNGSDNRINGEYKFVNNLTVQQCGCPDYGDKKLSDGTNYTCCKDGYGIRFSGDDMGYAYDSLTATTIKTCDCPDGGTIGNVNNYCCKNGYGMKLKGNGDAVYPVEYSLYQRSSGTSIDTVKECGCPLLKDLGRDNSTCCDTDTGKAYNPSTDKYDQDNLTCCKEANLLTYSDGKEDKQKCCPSDKNFLVTEKGRCCSSAETILYSAETEECFCTKYPDDAHCLQCPATCPSDMDQQVSGYCQMLSGKDLETVKTCIKEKVKDITVSDDLSSFTFPVKTGGFFSSETKKYKVSLELKNMFCGQINAADLSVIQESSGYRVCYADISKVVDAFSGYIIKIKDECFNNDIFYQTIDSFVEASDLSDTQKKAWACCKLNFARDKLITSELNSRLTELLQKCENHLYCDSSDCMKECCSEYKEDSDKNPIVTKKCCDAIKGEYSEPSEGRAQCCTGCETKTSSLDMTDYLKQLFGVQSAYADVEECIISCKEGYEKVGFECCPSDKKDFVTKNGKCCSNSATYDSDKDCFCANPDNQNDSRCLCPSDQKKCGDKCIYESQCCSDNDCTYLNSEYSCYSCGEGNYCTSVGTDSNQLCCESKGKKFCEAKNGYSSSCIEQNECCSADKPTCMYFARQGRTPSESSTAYECQNGSWVMGDDYKDCPLSGTCTQKTLCCPDPNPVYLYADSSRSNCRECTDGSSSTWNFDSDTYKMCGNTCVYKSECCVDSDCSSSGSCGKCNQTTHKCEYTNPDYYPSGNQTVNEAESCCTQLGGHFCPEYNDGTRYCKYGNSGCCNNELEDLGDTCYNCDYSTHKWVPKTDVHYCPEVGYCKTCCEFKKNEEDAAYCHTGAMCVGVGQWQIEHSDYKKEGSLVCKDGYIDGIRDDGGEAISGQLMSVTY